jgi:hypothetical protein
MFLQLAIPNPVPLRFPDVKMLQRRVTAPLQNSFTGISDLYHDAGLILVEQLMRRDSHGQLVLRRDIDRVVDAVQKHLIELVSISIKMVGFLRYGSSDLEMFSLQKPTQQLENKVDGAGQFKLSQRKLTKSRILHNLIHDLIHSFGHV